MFKLLFRKWWVVMIQGILLLLISFFIFRNPATVLTSISIWVGVLMFLSGLIGIFTSFSHDKSDNKIWALLWSIITVIFGFLLLTNILVTMKAITLLFGIWMLAGGLRFLVSGWIIRSEDSKGWIVIIAGLVSMVAAFMIMTNMGTGAIGISVLLGTQILIAGLALILLSLVKKKIGDVIEDKIEKFKSK
jgi:uncharacterized membrane protein HdeD (DUF308 family)